MSINSNGHDVEAPAGAAGGRGRGGGGGGGSGGGAQEEAEAAGGGPQPTERTALVVSQSHTRQAYLAGDAALSRRLHEAKGRPGVQAGVAGMGLAPAGLTGAGGAVEASEEAHQAEGTYTKTMVLGGLDGILTSFALVAGTAGGGLGWEVVLVLGFSNILADGLSMGVGEYLSSKAHQEYVRTEADRERWELKNFREGEISEMVDIYVQRGMSQEDAEDVIRKMAKYDELFVNVMVTEELGLQLNDDTEWDLIKEGFIMFLSFLLYGLMPLIGYCIFPPILPSLTSTDLFTIACAVTGISLFVLGAVKSSFSTRPWYWSGLETLVLGGICATVAYEMARIVNGLVS